MPKWSWGIAALVLILGVGFFIFNGQGSGTTYEGVLPGADCAGLKTELTLYPNGTYFLKETYLATRDGDKTFTSIGKWQKHASQGRAVIQLNYDKPQDIYNFLQKDADHIVVIDKELKMIDCPMNLTLGKK
ncbi:MAG: copper resistance protein NlpE [Candidatus Margulisiibacteriota bacterium]